MPRIWSCIAAMAVLSFAIKAAGPALLGARALPNWARDVIALLAPVMLVALVTTELLGPRWSTVDIRVVIGVGAVVGARLCRMPTLLAVVVGIGCTALLRALT